MPSVAVAGRRIGERAPVFVIAEIGTGHDGDLARAWALVDAAAEAGADCAKFQAVIADEIIHPNTGEVPLPGGSISLYERFRSLERGRDFYQALKEHTEQAGLVFLCTPFGPDSAAMLHAMEVAAFKIASPELNYTALIRQVAGYGRTIILSSGVSTLGDIERALEAAGSTSALLHCVTAYPAPAEEYNLRLLPSLASRFGVPVGLSDHSLDPVLVPAASVAAGGSIVEKHICLSRSGEGLDDPIALPPQEFRRMVEAIRLAELEGREATLDRLSSGYGAARVEAVMGDGIKRLAPSEEANYRRTNRSLHARSFIPAGELLTESNTGVLRTEKLLRPGLPPEHLSTVLGKRTIRDIPSGEGIRWEDLLST